MGNRELTKKESEYEGLIEEGTLSSHLNYGNEVLFLGSIAISLKRIADAMTPPKPETIAAYIRCKETGGIEAIELGIDAKDAIARVMESMTGTLSEAEKEKVMNDQSHRFALSIAEAN